MDRRVVTGLLAALVLLVALVGDPRAGTGDDGDAPATSSPTTLCAELDRMAVLRDALVDDAPGTDVADLRAAARHLRDLGGRTEGLGGRPLAGLDYFAGLFLALPDEPTVQQLLSAGRPASITDQAHADAFVAWLDDHCGPPPGAGR